jgi:hypothetical protein
LLDHYGLGHEAFTRGGGFLCLLPKSERDLNPTSLAYFF